MISLEENIKTDEANGVLMLSIGYSALDIADIKIHQKQKER